MSIKKRVEFYDSQPPDFDDRALRSKFAPQRFWRRKKNSWISERTNGRTLDIGCGSGVVSKGVRDVIGMDISKKAVKYCRESHNGEYLVSLAETLPFKNGSFDTVICADVIEHIPDTRSFLAEVHRVLKKGGKFIITTPNYFGTWQFVEFFWDRFGAKANYAEQHETTFNFFSIRRVLRKSNFSVIEEERIFLFSPPVSILSERVAERLLEIERKFRIPIACMVFLVAQRDL